MEVSWIEAGEAVEITIIFIADNFSEKFGQLSPLRRNDPRLRIDFEGKV